LRRFDITAMQPSVAPDFIRAIDHPVLERPAQAAPLLHPVDLVLGLVVHGQARAYPVNLLSLHEVVNDVVGEEPVAGTWCPVCSSALAFDRRVAGRTLTFGVSGYLFHSNQILFDRQTYSLWSQLLQGAVTGKLRGEEVRQIPLAETSWAQWLAAYPRTL